MRLFKWQYAAAFVVVFVLSPKLERSFAQPAGRLEQNVERCRSLGTPEARLKCYEALPLPNSSEDPSPQQWRLVRTPAPDGEVVSVMRTADTSRSDPDFAGLSIRCGKDGLEYVLIIIKPLPPRSRPIVTIAGKTGSTNLSATLLPSGAALRLADAVRALAAGPWQSQPELAITIQDQDVTLRGFVPLAGFRQALKEISATCPGK